VNAKTTIKKILFIVIWVCIAAGMFTLLMAGISKKNKGQCKDYSITIKGTADYMFVDVKDVEQMLMKATGGNIKGRQVSFFKLSELEQMLEQNTWISDAALYFDNHDVLHVSIEEREPIARIFTSATNSFYIDSAGKKLPLSDKMSARVTVFTGFPERKTLSSKDSLLLNDVRLIANFIYNDPFWLAQVSQMDITADKTFEMIPLVGNHVVKLGNAENVDQKFRRLMIFYQQVLNKTGFDKYKVIDVQYKGQVVASRYAGDPKVDSVQLTKNVEKLLKQYIDTQNDTIIRTMQLIEKYKIDTADNDSPKKTKNPQHKSDPNPGLSISTPTISEKSGGQAEQPVSSVPKQKKTQLKKDEKKKPKAVMPKKLAEEENGGYN
jgi:cell division protein FtsQ